MPGPASAPAKFAVLGFAWALREEVQHQGIRVHPLSRTGAGAAPGLSGRSQSPAGCRWRIWPKAVLYTLRQPAHVQLGGIGMTGI